jgi:ABC-type amino acid transport/signal transduction systems, periplasmic component/domain
MLSPARRSAIILAAALVILAACTGGGTNTSPSASTNTSGSTGTAASPVATVPDGQLVVAGNLFACIDIPYPPQEAFDDNGNPIGSDVDIAAELANRLGLKLKVENTVFDVIIPALTGGKCDIIISAQNINADRLKVVDMIPFFKAGQSFVVAKGNPKAIKAKADLCGKTIAVEKATTELDYLQGTSDYKGAGLSDGCVKDGNAAITIKQFDKDNDALLALQSGTADAYFADSPAAGYYVAQHGDQFELSGLTLDVALEGISVAKTNTGLRDAVKTALLSMISDGKYVEILQKWGLKDSAVTADEVNSGKL